MFEVGGLGKAHALKGEVAVHPMTDRPEVRFAPGAELYLDGSPVEVVSSRPHKGTWLVRFAHVHDRSQAERLRGGVLTAPALDGDDDTDTYWAHELVGMTVVAEDGADLGDVVEVIELPASAGYDLLEVRHPDGRTWFLPNADDLAEVVETEDGDLLLMVVDPPEGLLDPARAVNAAPDLAPDDDGPVDAPTPPEGTATDEA
jgi:16S rRNA processing protein RimM